VSYTACISISVNQNPSSYPFHTSIHRPASITRNFVYNEKEKEEKRGVKTGKNTTSEAKIKK
jgi:hypothetical protein